MLRSNATDKEILEFIDTWASLLEKEDYKSAYNMTKHTPIMRWTVTLIESVIKSYGDIEPTQKVTLLNNGLAIDGQGNTENSIQKKTVIWYDEKRGDIWYDLNIDNYVSDLTATFDIERNEVETSVILNDIHVM